MTTLKDVSSDLIACVMSRQQVKGQRDGQKKRKQTLSATDEPESKMGKTETAREKRASGTSTRVSHNPF